MEFKNVELRTRFRSPLRWVMVLLLGFIVQNTFAVETHILNGKWEYSGGKEENLPGNPYYVFTVESETEVNISLGNLTDNCTTDPYLHLLKMNRDIIEKDDDGSQSVFGYGNFIFKCPNDSHIKSSLPPGDYLLQAATYYANQSGSFQISVSGSGIPNFSFTEHKKKSQMGSWKPSAGRSLENNPRYEFIVDHDGTDVDISLKSSSGVCIPGPDPFLYLLNENGEQIAYNDDYNNSTPSALVAGCGLNSYIQQELKTGTYQLVAATYSPGETGEFQISVSGFGISNLLPVNSVQELELELDGSWDISAGKNTLLFGNPRYEFTVDSDTAYVKISLKSSDDQCLGKGNDGKYIKPKPYLYLLKEDDDIVNLPPNNNYFSDRPGTTAPSVINDRYQDWNASGCQYKSEIKTNLAKGKYQLVAATNEPYKSGDFVISIQGHGITGFKSNKYIKKRDFWVASAGQNSDHWANPQYKLTVTTDREVLIRLDTRADSDSTLPDPKLFLLPLSSNSEEAIIENTSNVEDNSDVMKKYEKLSENSVNTARSDYSFWGRAKGRNSVIRATLKAGEYKIVAATNELFESGDFVLSVGGLKEISRDNLEKIPHQGRQEELIEGRWTGSQNDKFNNHENPHYKMELKNKSFVNIEFKNHENCGDPNSLNLYLLDSFGNLETVHGRNKEKPCVATIERVLDKGVYELIATNKNKSSRENFTLSLGSISQEETSVSLLEIKNYSGEWKNFAGKRVDTPDNPHYEFMVYDDSAIDIRLEDTSDLCNVEIDPYIILLGPDGSRYESNLHNNFADKTKKRRCAKVARIQQQLPKGLYRLVAATEQANPDQWGYFLLSVSGSSVSELSELHFETPKEQYIKGAWKQLIGHNIQNFEDFSKKYTDNFYALNILKSGIVTIDLSSERDTYLFLLDKDKKILHRNDDIAWDDRNSRLKSIHLDKGMYYLVATTYSADDKEFAKYTIKLSSAQEVGVILYPGSSLDSSVIYGEWDSLIGPKINRFEDFSAKHSDHVHTLKMLESGTVTIDLMSVEADPYLYLYGKDKKLKYRNDNFIPKGSKISGSDKDSRLENIRLDKGVYSLVAKATKPFVDDKKSADYMIKLSSLSGVGFLFNSGSSSTMASPILDKQDNKYVVNSVDFKIEVESKINSFEHIPNKYHISHEKEVLYSFEWKDLKFDDWSKDQKKKKMFSNTIHHTLDLRLEDESFYVHLMDTKGQTWTSPVFNVDINKDLLKGTEMELEDVDFKNSILTFKIVNLDLDDLDAYFIEEFSSSGELLASSGWKSLGMEEKSKIGYRNTAKGEIRYVPHSEAAALKFTVKNRAGKLSYSNKQGTEQGIWTSIDLKGKNNTDDASDLKEKNNTDDASDLKEKNNTDDASDLKEKNNTDDAPTMTKPPRRKDDGSTARLDADGYIYSGNGDHASQPWACFRDNRTDLVWEVKANDDGIHGKDKVFTRINNELVQAANKAGSESLCGFNDWREPSKEELLTLIDPVNVPSSIAFNESYFPNTGAHFYWTSDPDGKVIDFGSGFEYSIFDEHEYDYKFRKRLVRGDMLNNY
jgi:hypothetical protein